LRPVSGQLSGTTGGGASHLVPVSCCLSGAGIRFSVIRFPLGNWAFLCGRLTGQWPDPDGVTTFHTHELRPGWVPPLPRGRRCSPGSSRLLGRRLPLHSGQSLHPATTSHPTRYRFTRHQRGFKQFTRPVFPSPVAPRWNGSPWALPRASNPTGSSPATHVGVGTGHEHGPGTTRSTSHQSILQSV
jgi:hypothetical protein